MLHIINIGIINTKFRILVTSMEGKREVGSYTAGNWI